MATTPRHGADQFLLEQTITTVEEAKTKIVDAVSRLKNEKLRMLCLLVTNTPEFWTSPASKKMHHAFKGGLAIHTAQVTFGMLRLLSVFKSSKVEEAFTAGLWHDFAKIYEYGQDGDYTTDGKLIGHISMGSNLFNQAAATIDLDIEATRFINHMILSHHGRLEWGSPVEPKTPEAYALHASDMLSASYTLS